MENVAAVDVTAGLEMYAQRGEWQKCLEMAATQGENVLLKHLLAYCSVLIKEGKYEQAVHQVVKSGIPTGMTTTCLTGLGQQAIDVYTRLAREVLYISSPEGVSSLREMLYKLVWFLF